ncbi:MAG TPA: NAD-dependent succinate-semialdehyde dehydrogenase [Thermoanaerobaculia bacterium]|nr:NAD-dependent succinate-semialdehyde dehydrogenase [Thermoanaerobaculia bacterium]
MSIASINPVDNSVLATFEPLDDEAIEAKLALAAESFRSWRKTPFAERAGRLLSAGKVLERERAQLGRVITLEMGKPIRAAEAEVAKSALVCRYYAENGERHLADEEVPTSAKRSYIRYEPLGTILAVMPWNFPFWQVFRFAAPALMAGNTALLKHASNVPQCAIAIERVLEEAGFPRGVFQTLLIEAAQVKRVLEDPRVAAATLTGSEPAGSEVAATAGRQIKKTVLELGGSDPFIVTAAAGIDEAITTGVRARMANSGQSCIAAKRFILVGGVAGEFERRFVAAVEALKIGDPMDEATDVGPLATPKIAADVERQVQETIAAGARLLTGGKRVGDGGNYYAPTVLTDIPRDSPAYRDEVFGPVASLFRVNDLDEAIRLANDTTFGLGASVWTNDPEEQRRFIEEIETGQVFVNAMVASDPRLPFGGVKRSGYGRELGVYGIREFANAKTVWIEEG